MADVDMAAENGLWDETKEARRKALWSLLEKWYNRRDMYWKQLSRSKYAKDMDRSSRFFHAIANSKSRRKAIQKLRINGEDVYCPRRIKKGAKSIFQGVIQAESRPRY